MKYLQIIFWLLVSWPITSNAEVSPFGLIVGQATLEEVQQTLGNKTKLTNRGLNKWMGGPMLRAAGDGLGIEGLQEVLFIFDQDNVLMGVILMLPKHRYEDIKRYLNEKYTLVSDQAPFVGNQSVKFKQGEVFVEANAPHLSFQMEVTYVHSRLREAFNSGSAQEVEQKQQQEGAQL